MNKFHKKRIKLHAINPYCSICGVLTWLPKAGDPRQQKKKNWPDNGTMATIGHKYSKFDERRKTESAFNKRYVIECAKCNCEKSRKEITSFPIEIQWEINKAWPKWHMKANIHKRKLLPAPY